MNRYGIVLNQLGLEPFASYLQTNFVHPLAKELFPVEGEGFDDHHCFCVRYSAESDAGLDMHEDDSDVTLNVCLGKEFTAATLSFCGMVDNLDHRKHGCTYEHMKGRAVIHLGRHRHGADNIAAGERVNFLLWSLNAKYRTSEQFRADRQRKGIGEPDRLCLSYTHDADYARYLGRPSRADAERRGVMLHQVEKRARDAAQPVRNLAAPGQEINLEPCLCVFLEYLQQPEEKKRVAASLVAVSEYIRAEEGLKGSAADALGTLPVYCAVSPGGATGQIRALCRVPEVAGKACACILDIRKGVYYPLYDADLIAGGEAGGGAAGGETVLEEFYAKWRKGAVEAVAMEGM
mmetsp:Transcript_3547/g.8412  ORF Transcript_3547/g.8412 Transcript_3547/m.8412 type:complete len:348 (+) Transcript_3547:882-1925(+)|eukprot:CAMPEP_0178994866 /NCGR_PEP_ID=MMETSP0795-20121207/7524_1 /TAXON_ID=88552 /ORGANISM="Amoebophrya sp., Strain Ameob2" /LENGTH=347 /DNA_ID=CAMNT_0020687139 /DNA_START=855 /DNA_END=1898 /DNA_ORIENTATION=+